LESDGRHEVFIDRADLEPGKSFDTKLRNAIEACDLFLFLISPESVAAGSYALSELSIAQDRWRRPGGHVLPVMVATTPTDAIPPYLRAVTILVPQGDVVAETLATVDNIRRPQWSRRRFTMLVAAIVVLGALGAVGYLQWQEQRAAEAAAQRADAEVATLSTAAQQLCESGDHALAWERFNEAIKRFPGRPTLSEARADCAMRWLREIRVRDDKGTFTEIVERALPVLSEAAATAHGQRAADLRAHMGWADFLRIREGAGGLDPETHYRKALTEETSNVYANAMWGHYIMTKGGPIADARQRFAAALASGRERAYVRSLQFSAMLYADELAGQIEAARVATDMRKSGEAVDPAMRQRLWTYVYADGLTSPGRRREFMSMLRDSEAPDTFRWLYPESEVASDRRTQWRFYLASLEEAAGDRAAARSHYVSLYEDLQREHASGSMLANTREAIKRLSSP
jgi:hypothetical protein